MSEKHPHIAKKYLVYALVCALVLYVILPQLGSLQTSLPLLRTADSRQALAAMSLAIASYCAAAAVYTLVALKPLQYGRTLLLQFASMFTNRLLPAGIGGMGLNYLYLRKQKHTSAQATTVVAVNNTLGFVGHLVLAAIILSLFAVKLPLHMSLTSRTTLYWAAAVAAVLILLIAAPRIRRRVRLFANQVASHIWSYRLRPGRLGLALLSSMFLTLVTVLSLRISCAAVGVDLTVPEALLIFSFGLSIGTATPTPGSLGDLEAGLVAGIVAYNFPAGSALAAVLLYRILTFWLPLIFGGLAFAYTKSRHYF